MTDIAVGSLWIRKRDKEPCRVDSVTRYTVSYVTSMLILWTTKRSSFVRNFRAPTPEESDFEKKWDRQEAP